MKDAEKTSKGRTTSSLVAEEPPSLAEDLRFAIAGLPMEADPYIIASLSQTRIMPDGGCGGHVFPAHAVSAHGERALLATMTAAPAHEFQEAERIENNRGKH